MDDIVIELEILRSENARLKELLHRHGITYDANPTPIKWQNMANNCVDGVDTIVMVTFCGGFPIER